MNATVPFTAIGDKSWSILNQQNGWSYRYTSSRNFSVFNNNRIVNYTLEKSIADGINVDYRVFRIKTQVTENGGAVKKEKI